jgi:hypothetical protein
MAASLGFGLRHAWWDGSAATGTLDGPRITPVWSTFFGGPGREECVAVLRGPGDFVTIVGQSDSTGFGMPAGPTAVASPDVDAFVGRFDASQPAASRLLWCTRLGGTGRECAFDAAVDLVTGATTVVGMTGAMDFPIGTVPAGANDGFILRLGADGRTVEAAARIGGTADDRICEVELGPSGTVFVAGVTESDDLPARTNEHHGGPPRNRTDAFVARLEPAGPNAWHIAWSLYLGGNGAEGQSVATWQDSERTWVGNLDWMGMAYTPAGELAIAMRSAVGSGTNARPATTSPDASQQALPGAADVYLAVVDSGTGALRWATVFGGRGLENPKDIVAHPQGGFVLGGATWSPDLPVTAGCFQSVYRGGLPTLSCDAFVAWIDPARGREALRYATYIGAEKGEDTVCALACAADGSVLVAGFSAGGLPLTHFLQPVPVRQSYGGFIAQLAMSGRGVDDLRFATMAAGPASQAGPVGWAILFEAVALDHDGAAWFTGISEYQGFPVRDAYQKQLAIGDAQRDCVLLQLRIPDRR